MKVSDIEQRQWILGVILLVASFVVFAQSLSFPLQTFDGHPMIVENESIHRWSAIPNYFKNDIWDTSGSGLRRYYRPFAMITALLIFKLVGLSAAGWHAASMLFHAAAVLVFWRLLREMGISTWVAFGTALLFAIYPIHVENVASVAGGTDPLLSVFFFGALFAYFRWHRSHSISWLILSMVLIIVSLLTKEVGAALPILMVLHDWFYREGSRESKKSRVLLWCSAVAVCAIYYAMRRMAIGGISSSPQHSWADVFRTAPYLAWLYLRQSIAPFSLAAWYDVDVIRHWSMSQVVLPAILCVVSFIAIVVGLAKRNIAAFWGAFWWLTLAVSLMGVRVFEEQDLVHDRYNYLPLAAFCLLLSYLLLDDSSPLRKFSKQFRTILMALLVIVMGMLSVAQTTTWRSDPALYAHAVHISPRSIRPRNMLAGELLKEGAVEEALRFSAETVQIDPNRWESHFTYGVALVSAGRTAESVQVMKRCIALDPHRAVAYIVGAREMVSLGDRSGALQLLESAPRDVELPEQISAEKRAVQATMVRQ